MLESSDPSLGVTVVTLSCLLRFPFKLSSFRGCRLLCTNVRVADGLRVGSVSTGVLLRSAGAGPSTLPTPWPLGAAGECFCARAVSPAGFGLAIDTIEEAVSEDG